VIDFGAKHIFALCEEVKSKLLDIALINNGKKNTIESIFSDIFRDPVIKQHSEGDQ
jgi:hypothetical protein